MVFHKKLLNHTIADELGPGPPLPPLSVIFNNQLIPLILQDSPWYRERGLSGTFQIWASGILPPKLRHILGYLLFQKKNSKKKRSYASQITFFKHNGKSIFWLLKYWPKLLKKKFNKNMVILFSNLLSESIFDC